MASVSPAPPLLTAAEDATPRSSGVVDRTLATVTNLAVLLPTGTLLAFQSLKPIFSDGEVCSTTAGKCLSVALIVCCALSCAFFSFTDTFVLGRGAKAFVGLATFRGFYPFNCKTEEEKRELRAADLRGLRIRFVDYVHALFSTLVFLSMALSDPDVQSCLFQSVSQELRQLLRNLPIAVGFLAGFVFLVFPTCRRGVGYSDMMPRSPYDESRDTGGGAAAAAGRV